MDHLTKGQQSLRELVSRCLVIAAAIHFLNLVIVPQLWEMVLMDRLLQKTGHLPHFLDHMAVGLSNAIAMHYLRRERKAD